MAIEIDFPKANEKIWVTFEESDRKLYELVDEKDNLLSKVSDTDIVGFERLFSPLYCYVKLFL